MLARSLARYARSAVTITAIGQQVCGNRKFSVKPSFILANSATKVTNSFGTNGNTNWLI